MSSNPLAIDRNGILSARTCAPGDGVSVAVDAGADRVDLRRFGLSPVRPGVWEVRAGYGHLDIGDGVVKLDVSPDLASIAIKNVDLDRAGESLNEVLLHALALAIGAIIRDRVSPDTRESNVVRCDSNRATPPEDAPVAEDVPGRRDAGAVTYDFRRGNRPNRMRPPSVTADNVSIVLSPDGRIERIGRRSKV